MMAQPSFRVEGASFQGQRPLERPQDQNDWLRMSPLDIPPLSVEAGRHMYSQAVQSARPSAPHCAASPDFYGASTERSVSTERTPHIPSPNHFRDVTPDLIARHQDLQNVGSNNRSISTVSESVRQVRIDPRPQTTATQNTREHSVNLKKTRPNTEGGGRSLRLTNDLSVLTQWPAGPSKPPSAHSRKRQVAEAGREQFQPPEMLSALERYITEQVDQIPNSFGKDVSAARLAIFDECFDIYITTCPVYGTLLSKIKEEYNKLLRKYEDDLTEIPKLKRAIADLEHKKNLDIDQIRAEYKHHEHSLRRQVEVRDSALDICLEKEEFRELLKASAKEDPVWTQIVNKAYQAEDAAPLTSFRLRRRRSVLGRSGSSRNSLVRMNSRVSSSGMISGGESGPDGDSGDESIKQSSYIGGDMDTEELSELEEDLDEEEKGLELEREKLNLGFTLGHEMNQLKEVMSQMQVEIDRLQKLQKEAKMQEMSRQEEDDRTVVQLRGVLADTVRVKEQLTAKEISELGYHELIDTLANKHTELSAAYKKLEAQDAKLKERLNEVIDRMETLNEPQVGDTSHLLAMGSVTETPRFLRTLEHSTVKVVRYPELLDYINEFWESKTKRDLRERRASEPAEHMKQFLLRKSSSPSAAMALGANVWQALHRYRPYSSEVAMMFYILQGSLCEDSRNAIQNSLEWLRKKIREEDKSMRGKIKKSVLWKLFKEFRPGKKKEEANLLQQTMNNEFPKDIVDYSKIFKERLLFNRKPTATLELMLQQEISSMIAFRNDIEDKLRVGAGQSELVTPTLAFEALKAADPYQKEEVLAEWVKLGFTTFEEETEEEALERSQKLGLTGETAEEEAGQEDEPGVTVECETNDFEVLIKTGLRSTDVLPLRIFSRNLFRHHIERENTRPPSGTPSETVTTEAATSIKRTETVLTFSEVARRGSVHRQQMQQIFARAEKASKPKNPPRPYQRRRPSGSRYSELLASSQGGVDVLHP